MVSPHGDPEWHRVASVPPAVLGRHLRGVSALRESAAVTCPRSLSGTPTEELNPWQAPEVMKAVLPGTAAYDLSADIFSFGIVISEAIVGKEAEEVIDETRTYR